MDEALLTSRSKRVLVSRWGLGVGAMHNGAFLQLTTCTPAPLLAGTFDLGLCPHNATN